MKLSVILVALIIPLQIVNSLTYQWELLPSETQSLLTTICLVDENTAWVAGLSGSLLKSTDGGNNWTPQNIGYNTHFQKVLFTSSQIGWLAGQKSL